jgi:Bacterial regulatory helix-turn-helix protein, lysR family
VPDRANPSLRFIIARYAISIKVSPVRAGTQHIRHGKKERPIKSENIALISKSVTFSPRNKRSSSYELRYSTREGGFISDLQTSVPNEAPPEDKGRYDDYGHEVTFCFHPEPSKAYSMSFSVLKGFEVGNRNIHYHMPPHADIANVSFTLDLSEYHSMSIELIAPRFYYHLDDPVDHDVCRLRGVGQPLSATHSESGLWTWNIAKVRGGVIDVDWDNVTRTVVAPAHASKTLMRLIGAATTPRFKRDMATFVDLCKLIDSGASTLKDASTLLHCSRSTLSYMVKRLEDRLSAPLLLRPREGNLSLTEEGLALYSFGLEHFRKS